MAVQRYRVILYLVVVWCSAGFGLLCLADCNTECLEVSCWQVTGSSGAYNCRKTLTSAICSLPGWTQVYHLAPGGEGAICKSPDPLTYVDVYNYEYCNPECPNIPGKASGCLGFVGYFGRFPDSECVIEASTS